MNTLLRTLALLLAVSVSAWAERQEEQRCEAAPDGLVRVKNTAGSVQVKSWDKNEVWVKAVFERDSDKLNFACSPGRTEIEIHPQKKEVDLTVCVPAQSSLKMETVSAGITVEHVSGKLKLESVSGSITVTGDAKAITASTVSGDLALAANVEEVEAESVSGDIDCTGNAAKLQAKSVSGGVKLAGALGKAKLDTFSGSAEITGTVSEVEVQTISGRIKVDRALTNASLSSVSGELDLTGEQLKDAELETTGGNIEYKGALADKAAMRIESASGSVRLTVPESIAAQFDASTLSGNLHDDFGAEPEQAHAFSPERTLHFTQGNGAGSVRIKTLSGSVEIRKQ